MPVEEAAGTDRRGVSHLEALGRLVAGMAPWIELPPTTRPRDDCVATTPISRAALSHARSIPPLRTF